MQQQKSSGRPAGRKNTTIRADRLEVIQLVTEKLITGMATASSSELAQAIWPETALDKTTLNAKSKTVRLALQNIADNPELAKVPRGALLAALSQRAGLKKDLKDIAKEKEEREAARRSRLELQKKDWMSQPVRLMESRIKAAAKEALGIFIGEGVTPSNPTPSFNVRVASNTFTRESALRVLELELKIQLHTALRYTWDGEEAWNFYMKAKDLVRVNKKLFKADNLSREEILSLERQLKQLRDEVEDAYEKMNAQRGWADPDLTAGQQLSNSELKNRIIEHHTDRVESWAADKLPADVQIPKDLRYPEADKPWEKEPLQQLESDSFHTLTPIDESTIKRDIANTIAGSSLRIAGIAKETLKGDQDFYTTEELEYLCMFYDRGNKEAANNLKKSIGSVIRKYQWLQKHNLVNYYKGRYQQKEKAPAEAGS
ncbi:hypothetical protein [Desulfitobacterium hafniense]|uniref:hypothetical protein n=1 Tax=Desulfitobacterium hafniense TaxID=49338 RepID=UPI000364ED62|nr:hypothetical protein [Desulfitobacterium hafniense]